jgi:hypothetical protein
VSEGSCGDDRDAGETVRQASDDAPGFPGDRYEDQHGEPEEQQPESRQPGILDALSC